MVMLVGLDAFKSYAGITNTTGAEDENITAIIEGISDAVEKHCHRQFSYGSYDQYWDIQEWDETSVQVDNPPLVSVVALTDNGTLVSTDKYHVYTGKSKIALIEQTYISQHYRRDQYFTRGYRKVVATYYGGFQDIPKSIQLIAKRITSRIYNSAGKEEMESETIGDYKYVRAKMDPESLFLAEDRMLMSLYVLIN